MGEATAAPNARATVSDPSLSADRLRAAYRTMVLARVMDERCLTLQRQGRIGFYVPMQGQEAAQVGSALALLPEDWIFPVYRELGVALTRGIPLAMLIDQFLGNSGDAMKGRQMPNHYGYRPFNFVTASSPVGTQITHAVGAAMAARWRSKGPHRDHLLRRWHDQLERLSCGAELRRRVPGPDGILLPEQPVPRSPCPATGKPRSATLAEKASAYESPGVVVDGTDVHAVYRAVHEARERALAGDGPTLIEAQMYRLGPHSTSDDPRRYRTDAGAAGVEGQGPRRPAQARAARAQDAHRGPRPPPVRGDEGGGARGGRPRREQVPPSTRSPCSMMCSPSGPTPGSKSRRMGWPPCSPRGE